MHSQRWPDVRTFGVPVAGREYDPRPGAYAVVLDTEKRVAAVRNVRGTFLPGGGAEPGETPEQTLQREVLEECGYAIDELERLGEATEWVLSAGKARGLEKRGVFFRARFAARVAEPSSEADQLVWLPPVLALNTLTLASQVWVTRRVTLGDG